MHRSCAVYFQVHFLGAWRNHPARAPVAPETQNVFDRESQVTPIGTKWLRSLLGMLSKSFPEGFRGALGVLAGSSREALRDSCVRVSCVVR
eukprot:3571009-Alexandrium_andersonii.AAC.1